MIGYCEFATNFVCAFVITSIGVYIFLGAVIVSGIKMKTCIYNLKYEFESVLIN